MAKKKVVKRKTTGRKSSKGIFEAHPNLKWLLPLLIAAYFLSTLIK